jgi:hypothetical protein
MIGDSAQSWRLWGGSLAVRGYRSAGGPTFTSDVAPKVCRTNFWQGSARTASAPEVDRDGLAMALGLVGGLALGLDDRADRSM